MKRVAVLVDGDNVSAQASQIILSVSGTLGRIDLARAYGSGDHPSGWMNRPGFRFIHANVGKNAADLLLTIDAMDLALVVGFDTFVLVSSDADFTHLAQRLRERGLHVLGLGDDKAPEMFRAACSEFQLLPRAPVCKSVSASAGQATAFDLLIRQVIAANSKEGRGMRITALGQSMFRAHNTRISSYPEKNWRDYLSKRPDLYDLDPRGPDAMVRFVPKGFASA